MRSFIKQLFIAIAAISLVGGCIKNDVPYPVIKLGITGLQVEGQKGAAIINAAERTVVVDLLDTEILNNIQNLYG